MSTQQDIYAAGFKNCPPMLNKDKYVPWSSRLLRHAKRKPDDREVLVAETFHEQTDEELTEKEIKQMEADDQATQTILLGLPKDIYAAVDSCDKQSQVSQQSTTRMEMSYHYCLSDKGFESSRLHSVV
ncbi:hypothetical protein Tco_0778882 [Tanacetum coccineum]